MNNRVILCENALDRSSWQTFECDDVREFLTNHFSEWPKTARIYFNYVCVSADVTPYDEASVERLGKLSGDFFVVVYPESFLTIILIVSLALSAVSVIMGYLMRPALPKNQQEQSPTNSLSNRENRERINQRIPDIYGTLWVTPDLIQIPYRIFIGNKEVEFSYMCIGRGRYDIAEVRDDVTPIAQINGAGCAIYEPDTSPNSGDAPQMTIGEPINEPIKCIKKYSSINGQTLRAPNANKIKGSKNIRFTDDGTIQCSGDLDFTDYFSPSTISNPKYVVVGNSDYNGTYEILDVTTNEIVLVDPASVNSAWSSLSGQTDYGSASLIESGNNWEGPFTILDNTVTEIKCNFVAMQGLYELDNDGNQHAINTTIQIEITSIDNNYNPQGNPIYFQTTLKGSDVLRTMCGVTLEAILPFAGACQVRARRISNTDLRDNWNVIDQVQWRDLYAASPITETDFGNVTTIQTITWPTAAALSIKQRKLNVLIGRKIGSTSEAIPLVQSGGLMGCWANDAGEIIGNPLAINNSFGGRVPLGATRLQLGINDGTTWSDNYTDLWTIALKIDGISQANFTMDGKHIPWRTAGGINSAFNAVAGMTTGTDPYVIAVSPNQIVELNYISGLTGQGAPTAKTNCDGQDGLDGRSSLNLGRYIPNAIQITTEFIVSENAADIICAMALDSYIGRRIEAEIDRTGIQAILGAGGEVETYFGTNLCTQFSYAFDDSKVSFEEMLAQVCQAVFCTAYRRGNVLCIAFEKETIDSTILFNHRNKIPGTETRTANFGAASQNDGIDIDYIEPNAPNAQNIDSVFTLHFPQDESATAARKVNAIGVRNRVQAWILGWRMFNKLLYQNIAVQFDATAEAGLSIINDRLLIADNTRPNIQDGQVEAQDVLELTLSQPVIFVEDRTYTMFIQHYDKTIEAIAITEGSEENKVILAEAPSMPLVLDPEKFAKTTYMIVDDAAQPSSAFLLQEKPPKEGGIWEIKAINYDERYYEHDEDYINDVIDILTPGTGSETGYDKQASVSVFVDGKTMPWVSPDNSSFEYGINDGKSPVAVPIQAAEGETVAITGSAPGQATTYQSWQNILGASNTVQRSSEGSPVDVEGEDDHITGDSNDFGGGNGYFPTHYTTDKSLGRCGLVGAWAKKNIPTAGKYQVVAAFVIGYGGNFTVPAGGVDTLLLGINDNKFSDNRGGFQVLVTQTGTAAGDAAAQDPVPDNNTTNPNSVTYIVTANGI